jgi:putative endopeptidase
MRLSGWRAALLCAAALIAVPASADPQAGTPFYGSWGFDRGGQDAGVKPGDNFFAFANGHYQDTLVIPSDRSSYSPRLQSAERVQAHIREILEHAAATAPVEPRDEEGKIGALYAAFMDEARVEALGVRPLAADLTALRGAASRIDLARLMATANESFHGSLFNVDVQLDVKDPQHYAVVLGQSGLSLPDRDYYLDPKFAPQKAAFRAHASRVLTLAGWPDAEARADDIVALETAIAQASWTRAEQRDADKTYNPMTVAELERLAPGFPWRAFLEASGIPASDRVIVGEKTAFPKLAAVFAETPERVLQAWGAMRLVDNASAYLSSPFTQAAFEFYGRDLSGQQQQEARWKRAIRAVSGGDGQSFGRADLFGNMGWAVGRAYTAKYFPPQAKARVEAMVVELKAAFKVRLENLDWMSPATRDEAIRKLDAITVRVGYPEHAPTYDTVTIRRDDLYGDVLRLAQAEWRHRAARLNGPVDRTEWFMTPQMNNAYNGSFNDIVFPAAILTPPIFDLYADDAINYGAVGAVIGHEITHGFDDQGRKYDSEGRLRDWWTAQDAATFEARAARLGAQYATYEPLPGVHVNPAMTMGENIADLGGVVMALDAYRASLKGRPAPVIDGYTGEQRVFLGWAQAWRGQLRDDAMRKLVASDPHSPRQFRVNGPVRNIDAWYAAFGVKPGDQLYLAPDERVRIW